MAVDALVINLTRFGDLLQSQALINDLACAGCKTGLICLDNFASALPLLDNVSEAWALPGARFLTALDHDWPKAAKHVAEFARTVLKSANPSHILNITPSLPARLLTRLLSRNGASVYGFGMDNFGYGVNHGFWASFVSVAAAKRLNSPFNLADMMRMLGAPLSGNQKGSGRLKQPDPRLLKEMADRLFERSGPVKGYVAFQLGASENRRRWPVEYFSKLGDRIWQATGHCPVLVGARHETPLAERYAALAAHTFINVMGQTDLRQLAAVLQSCRLLVTNDTGTMHLAAGLEVPSLSFFLATAQPWDTGPNLAGCCALEPSLDCHPCAFGQECEKNEQCRKTITPETAASLAISYLRDGAWQGGITANAGAEARVWLTTKDSHNFNHLTPQTLSAKSGRSLWLMWLRAFWQGLLGELDGFAAGSHVNSYANLPLPENAAEISAKCVQAVSLLQAICECAKAATKNPGMGKIFLRNCERLQTFLTSFGPLHSLGAFWREIQANYGDNLEKFGDYARVISAHAAALGKALDCENAVLTNVADRV